MEVSPFSHHFQKHVWTRGQIMALTLGHSGLLHGGSDPDTSWLLILQRPALHSAAQFGRAVCGGEMLWLESFLKKGFYRATSPLKFVDDSVIVSLE